MAYAPPSRGPGRGGPPSRGAHAPLPASASHSAAPCHVRPDAARHPSPPTFLSARRTTSPLFSSASEEERPRPSRSTHKRPSKRKGVVYRSLPVQGAAGGQERVAPQDVPAREEGPGGGAMSSMTAGKPASRTWLWVTIAAVVLLLVAGGGAAYYFRDNLRSLFGGSSDTTPSASSSGTSAPATTAASSIGTAVSSSAPLSGSAASSGSAAATASTSAASSTASSSNGISPSQSYTLAQNCTGTSFFSCFSFNTNKGVSESVATESGLVNVNGSAAYLRLNSWTDTSEDRPKLYLEMSENMFRYGLVVVDVGKIPWGCGAWSSIFSFGGDWPNGGGIDILEGISLMEQSTPTVITSNSSCKIGNASGMTGTPLDGHTDCNGDTTTGGYAGCSVQNPDTASYGEKWNDAGGGVLASLLDETGLYIWQFPRTDAAKLDFANPDPSSWGLPLAAWPASTCDTDFFSEQTVAVTLGVCGTRPEANWAGECAQAADSCAEYVKTGTNLENMVWQINYLSLFDVAGGSSSSSGGISTAKAALSTSKGAPETGGEVSIQTV